MLPRSTLVLCLLGSVLGCSRDATDLSAPKLNAPPAAAFAGTCAHLTCTFTDTSSDPDGWIASYRWSFGDESADQATRNTVHTYPAPGPYTVALTVTDNAGATDRASHVFQAVLPANSPPTAAFGSSCAGLTCTFSDSSSDPDGIVVSHHWTFGDGQEADEPTPSHTYGSAGIYTVRLNVTDDRGAGAEASREVVLSPPTIVLNPTSITIYARRYYGPSHVNLRIENGGAGTLHWVAATTSSWLTLSATSGTAPATIVVTVDNRAAIGGYSRGSITVTATEASNSPQTFSVTHYLR